VNFVQHKLNLLLLPFTIPETCLCCPTDGREIEREESKGLGVVERWDKREIYERKSKEKRDRAPELLLRDKSLWFL